MIKKIKFFLLKIGIFGLKSIYLVIKLFPTSNKITFISRQLNNPSLDFQILQEKLKKTHPQYKIITLAKRIDNKLLYSFHMIKQMYHIATSKVVLLDSYCIVISLLHHKKSLKVIQMWHAVGSMKKFGYAIIGKPEGSDKDIAKIMCMHKNYDYILISSRNFIKDYLEGFRCNKEQVVEIPLPRVDFILNEKYVNKERKRLLMEIPKLKNKKNILYCPTFRKSAETTEHINKLIENIDFKKYNLLYKPHPLSKIKFKDNRVIQKFKNTYEALMVADYVISDYSSIIYEVGLLDIPIYLYAYDWEKYKKKRQINFDIEHEVPTLFTADSKKIIEAIEKDEFNHEAYQEFTYRNITLPKERNMYRCYC